MNRQVSDGGGVDNSQSGRQSAADADVNGEGTAQTLSAGVKGTPKQRLEYVVNSYIGVPYKYGGTTNSGFDCSGFVSAVYREVYGVTLGRTSGQMWKVGKPVALTAARPGDLVFFRGGAFSMIDHVGIYMGNNRFAHASSTAGVMYSRLGETYHARRFAGVRRML